MSIKGLKMVGISVTTLQKFPKVGNDLKFHLQKYSHFLLNQFSKLLFFFYFPCKCTAKYFNIFESHAIHNDILVYKEGMFLT